MDGTITQYSTRSQLQSTNHKNHEESFCHMHYSYIFSLFTYNQASFIQVMEYIKIISRATCHFSGFLYCFGRKRDRSLRCLWCGSTCTALANARELSANWKWSSRERCPDKWHILPHRPKVWFPVLPLMWVTCCVYLAWGKTTRKTETTPQRTQSRVGDNDFLLTGSLGGFFNFTDIVS